MDFKDTNLHQWALSYVRNWLFSYCPTPLPIAFLSLNSTLFLLSLSQFWGLGNALDFVWRQRDYGLNMSKEDRTAILLGLICIITKPLLQEMLMAKE